MDSTPQRTNYLQDISRVAFSLEPCQSYFLCKMPRRANINIGSHQPWDCWLVLPDLDMPHPFLVLSMLYVYFSQLRTQSQSEHFIGYRSIPWSHLDRSSLHTDALDLSHTHRSRLGHIRSSLGFCWWQYRRTHRKHHMRSCTEYPNTNRWHDFDWHWSLNTSLLPDCGR